MIRFRPLVDDINRGIASIGQWQVEYWSDSRYDFGPMGLAWVTQFEPIKDADDNVAYDACIDYILVRDEYRRRGIAFRLVKACRERWPTIMLTDPVSPAGEAFLRKLARYDSTGQWKRARKAAR